ncbi:antA/AntB antirepressor family protein [Muricomes sp. OA1]|uniref:antA/AntB antirepressor family protein n=1 Tax=Lachnospiraceae TaxID=186803 RepID=UPI00129D3272|nr:MULTISPECIES: antA/AntB antirepressor family protein [Lachnospiraceae]MCH1974727.1 antA/AntB antirepressor family protein [Muricomes sp. OA1]MRM89633.1 toxin Bro [Faecalicatena contorta]GKH33507.1 hypothetical protein CE91St64_29140 [Faecalicatena contorta]
MTNEIMKDKLNRTPIEIALGIDEKGMTTAKKLYEFLELHPASYARWYKSNIADNEFAEENVDFFPFNTNAECGGQASKDAKLTARFAKKLSMTQKNQKGEEARDYFTRVEDGAKEMVLQMQEMSPQLQFMIKVELEQKRQGKEQERQAKELEDVKENQKAITQALSRPVEKSFREWVNGSLSAIAESSGFQYIGSMQDRHRAVRTESYDRLNRKRPCRLDQRLDRAKGEAARAGATKTQIKDITKLTVIEGDKDLKPVYEAVIREMLVVYKVNI